MVVVNLLKNLKQEKDWQYAHPKKDSLGIVLFDCI